MKTYSTREADIKREWHVIDATDQILGRLATRIARLLMGKHKPIFSPNMDTGDYVIVTNASKIRVTGNKTRQKIYYRHTGYPGGHKFVSYEDMMQKSPEKVIEMAVRRMLPKNKLARDMLKKLKVFRGPEHTHAAQKPESITL